MNFITAVKASDLSNGVNSKDFDDCFDLGIEINRCLEYAFNQINSCAKNGFRKTFWSVYIRGDQDELDNFNAAKYTISILESLGYKLDVKVTKWFDHLPMFPSEELINSQTVPENGRDYEVWISW